MSAVGTEAGRHPTAHPQQHAFGASVCKPHEATAAAAAVSISVSIKISISNSSSSSEHQ
jgi:hypothetical protein